MKSQNRLLRAFPPLLKNQEDFNGRSAHDVSAFQGRRDMMTRFDHLPAQNGYKVRLLLRHWTLTEPGYSVAHIAVFIYVGPADEAGHELDR